jgi:hypothetical protein
MFHLCRTAALQSTQVSPRPCGHGRRWRKGDCGRPDPRWGRSRRGRSQRHRHECYGRQHVHPVVIVEQHTKTGYAFFAPSLLYFPAPPNRAFIDAPPPPPHNRAFIAAHPPPPSPPNRAFISHNPPTAPPAHPPLRAPFSPIRLIPACLMQRMLRRPPDRRPSVWGSRCTFGRPQCRNSAM